MEPFSQRRNGTCRQARTDKLCQIVRLIDRLAQHLPPTQNLGNRFCFHTGPLATYDTPFGRHLQSGSACKSLPESLVRLYRCCTDVGISCPSGHFSLLRIRKSHIPQGLCESWLESTAGSQLFLFRISAILLIPLRGLQGFFLEPPSGSVTPSRTRTHFGFIIDVTSER